MDEQSESQSGNSAVVMPSGETFELNTFADLLKLNDDQLDRLCVQLPSTIKQVSAISVLLGAASDGKTTEMLTPLKWKDDGEKGLKINITSGGEKFLEYESKSE